MTWLLYLATVLFAYLLGLTQGRQWRADAALARRAAEGFRADVGREVVSLAEEEERDKEAARRIAVMQLARRGH